MGERADVSLLVVRSGFTRKGALKGIQEAVHAHKLNNAAIILNNVNIKKQYGYHYGYGYGYYD